MANDKEDKGFQIPIEDTNEEAAETTANAEEAVKAEPVAEEAAEAAEADSEAAAEADAEAADELSADDPDIVAEAEAVLEEADIDTLEEAQAKAKEWQDRYLRLHAEWDTYRRRTAEQREEEKVRGFAAERNLDVVADIPRSDEISRCEDEWMTAVEGAPESDAAQRFRALAELLLADGQDAGLPEAEDGRSEEARLF